MSIQLSTRVMHIKDQTTGSYDTVDILKGSGIDDVQVNGTSVVTDGVANVPLATSTTPGVAIVDPNWGVYMTQSDPRKIAVAFSQISQIKNGISTSSAICPERQHAAAFYGLAKASGDTTQSSSSNPVGTYTETARSKISDMLNAPVSVSGTTPTITGMSGVRYICGEVSTLSITPPASGDVEVMFESGSTATVLTVPNTVKWTNGFDPTSLDANTVYDMIITDGIYGMVASWEA